MLLPRSSLWWLPDGGKGLLEFYAWLCPIPLAFIFGAIVLRMKLRQENIEP